MSLTVEQQELLTEALGWIRAQAVRIKARYPAMQVDDLFGLGRLEAAEQLRRFDAPRGTFQQYAMKAVRGAMMNEVVRTCWGNDAQLARVVSAFGRNDHYQPTLAESMAMSTPASPRAAVVEELRQAVVPMVVASALADASPAQTPDELLDHAQRKHALREAVDALPESDRSLIDAFYVEEQTLDEIAKSRGVGKSTVQRHHEKLKQELAARLSARGFPVQKTG